MRHRWVLLAAAVLVVGCADDDTTTTGAGPDAAVVVTPAIQPLPDAEVVARAGAAVWRVATDGCGWLGSGSAFAVDEQHLVTNRHVIANDTSPTLISPSGEERQGRVIGASDDVDVAVIEVERTLPVTLQWAPTDVLQPGEHVVVLGYPAPELTFKTTVGSIVNFQGRRGAREAMLTDAPISPGNSGGPGLRADATVAGVVTQMTLDDPSQRAAIMFSAASVEAAVASFIAQPAEVLSECGQGPDYVPPIPDHFDVPAPPPPPPATATTLPLPLPTAPTPTATTRPAVPPTTRRPPPPATTAPTEPEPSCPDGAPALGVDAVTATPGEEAGTWRVSVDVVVDNRTAAPVDVSDLLVEVGGEVGHISMDDVVIGPGEIGHFDVDVPGPVIAAEPPDRATAHMEWSWVGIEYGGCPSEPVELNQPDAAAD